MLRGYLCALALLAVSSAATADTLFDLTIEPEAGTHTYDRSLYRHWIDADGDRLDTRHEVLVDESLIPPTVNSSGRVTEGLWVGLYSGFVTTDPGSLQIDHMIPLAEAHRSGAHAWNSQRRQDFANDLEHPQALIAVKGGANASKGDRDPANWMPPNRSYWCRYLADWIAIKQRWELSIDQAEADAISRGVHVCDLYKSGDHLDGRH